MNQNNKVTAKYTHEFSYLDDNYQVHIKCYEHGYLKNEAVGQMKTRIIILKNGHRTKELYLPEPIDKKESERVFADVEKKLEQILK